MATNSEKKGSGMARRSVSLVMGMMALLAALLVGALPGTAAGDFQITLPAGTACPGFAVSISGSGGNSSDKIVGNGRIITTGTGSNLVFTNVATGETLALKSNGAPKQTTTNEDGTLTVTSEGHQVIVLFPTDTPPGPSTTLIVGRVVYTVDAAGNFVVQSVHGNTTNICAKLS